MTTPFPQVVRIEPYGGNCNFHCRHCPTGLNGGNRGLLSYDDFVYLFDSLPLIPRTLVLYHGSEPFVNRDLQKMLTYAKGKGVQKTVLNTNAALIRPVADLDEMRVSFDGQTPQENNLIRLGGDFFKQAEKVKQIIEAGQKVVVYNTSASGGESAEPAPYLVEMFGDTVTYRTEPMRLWSSQEGTVMGLEVVSKPTNVRFCSNLFDTFTILSDGTVPKCCEDLPGDFIYGNAFDEAPLSIWYRMEAVRREFAAGHYPDDCANCWVVAGRYLK